MHLEQSHNQYINTNSTRQITPWPTDVLINLHRIRDHGSVTAQQACNLPNTSWRLPCLGTRYKGRPTVKISSTCCNSLRWLRCSKKPSNGPCCKANESKFTLRLCSFKTYLNITHLRPGRENGSIFFEFPQSISVGLWISHLKSNVHFILLTNRPKTQ
jgi:hypothetical protein